MTAIESHAERSATERGRDAAPRIKVAFVDREPRSGFLSTDLACLERDFDVERIVYPGRNSISWIVTSLRAASRCHVLYVFFASEHALAPVLAFRLLRRRVVLVQGGYDYADVPERAYGLAARGHGWLPRLIGRLCSVSLAISTQSRDEFVALVPCAADRTRVSYLAVDAETWNDPGVERRADRIVTFGYIDDEAYSRKGIDRFVAAAVADPTHEYVLAGRLTPSVAARVDAARSDVPHLVVTGHLDHDALARLLWSAGVYAQLSWHETFGVAMAEAMLCGCVPVIGNSPALAEVGGSWAVHAGDASSVADDVAAIAAATESGRHIDRADLRADTAGRFAVEQRAAALRDAIEGER